MIFEKQVTDNLGWRPTTKLVKKIHRTKVDPMNEF